MEEYEDFEAQGRSRPLYLILQDKHIRRGKINRLLGRINSLRINISWEAVDKRLRSLEIYPSSSEYKEAIDAWELRLRCIKQMEEG